MSNEEETSNNKGEELSLISRLKIKCLYIKTSVQEGFGYVKAFFVGQAKKMTAKDEKEASEADLQTAKTQVEATDAAEVTKDRLIEATKASSEDTK